MPDAYRIFAVVDRNYGVRLADLAERGSVWIVDTPSNRAVAQRIWAANRSCSQRNSVTTFKFIEGSSSEDVLIDQLDVIDLHHPACTSLEVIGTDISARLRAELSELGFGDCEETAEGFRVRRLRNEDVGSQ